MAGLFHGGFPGGRLQQIVAVLVLATSLTAAAQKLKKQHAWYHTSSEIHSELNNLSSHCSGAKLSVSKRIDTSGAKSVELDVVHVSRDGLNRGHRKAFYVFGEHARELISPESALHFLRVLCGGGDETDQFLARQALEDTAFVIIPNANPLGRKQVEMGEYCKRTNEHGVDLNRNWDHGETKQDVTGLGSEINPGPHSFSEPETRVLRDLVQEEKPDVFLSVHSGAYLLGMPTAPTGADAQNSSRDMLSQISQDFCNGDCPFGDLTKVIGYKSQGCDINYVTEHTQTPYAFTWEIYANADIRQFFAEKSHALSENRSMNGAAKMYFSMKNLMFAQTGRSRRLHRHLRGHDEFLSLDSPDDADNDDCFAQFNPVTQAETQEVVAVWAKAFMTLGIEVRSLPGSKTSKS